VSNERLLKVKGGFDDLLNVAAKYTPLKKAAKGVRPKRKARKPAKRGK
jgi:hypothetical protein